MSKNIMMMMKIKLSLFITLSTFLVLYSQVTLFPFRFFNNFITLTHFFSQACLQNTEKKNMKTRLEVESKIVKKNNCLFYIIYCPSNVNVQRNLSYFIMLVSLWKKINKRFFCSSQLYYIAFIVNRWAWFFRVDWATKWTRFLFFCLLTI